MENLRSNNTIKLNTGIVELRPVYFKFSKKKIQQLPDFYIKLNQPLTHIGNTSTGKGLDERALPVAETEADIIRPYIQRSFIHRLWAV